MGNILSEIRKLLNHMEIHEDDCSFGLDQIIQTVSHLIQSNVYLIDQTGLVIGRCVREMNQLNPFNRCELGEMIETGLDKVLKTNQVVANINLYKDDTKKVTIFPKRCTT